MNRMPEYSTDPQEPLYFFGGMFSNFDSRRTLWLPPQVAPPQAAFVDVPLRFGSGEHWLHCGKARTWKEHEYIRKAPVPFGAKERGRALPLDPEEVSSWDERRYDVMVVGLRAKAAQHADVQRYLLSTGDRLIAEDSPTDFIWGIRDERGGFTGQNLLGKAWMQVREELRS